MMRQLMTLTALFALAAPAHAGPFSAYTETGVPADQIARWADGLGPYEPSPGVGDAFNNPSSALGPADGAFVALGDLADPLTGPAAGRLTVSFSAPIFDGPGADFAVFENAGEFFDAPYIFAELAYVEVSSNGLDFARLPAESLNIEPDDNGEVDPDELLVPFGRDFAGVDTTNIRNLAGVHPSMTGTPFDLADLAGDAAVQQGLVDLGAIRHVRLIDIPGDGFFVDSSGRPILDTWPTVDSGGFDFDAVGAINVVPEPCAALLAGAVCCGFAATRRARPE